MLEVTSAINPLSPDLEKDSPQYGLKLMKAAIMKYQTGYLGESRLARKNRFDYNRAFSMGKQPMDEYKDLLDLDGELSVINLPYDPLKIAIPFLSRLKDRYLQRDEIIQCSAVDPFVQGKKKSSKDNAIFKLKEKENILAAQQNAGVPLEDFSDNDPQSLAEIDVEFGFNYKEREEVIMENLINIVFYETKFSTVIKNRLMDDLINCGYAGTKTYINGSGRIAIRPIRPENIITSFCEFDDFSDWQYLGETYYMSIMEVRMLYPEKISEQKLYELSQTLVGKYGNPSTGSNISWSLMYQTALARPYDSWRVPIVDISFKTLYNLKKTIVIDRFGKEAIVTTVTNPNAEVKDITSNPYYVEYTGVMIMDTEHLLEWGLSKNMVKPSQNLEEIVSPYTFYMYNNMEMVNTPLIETMIPIIKEMQLAKLQQLKIMAAAAPDGYDIDIATMSDVDLGGGKGALSPLDLYKIYKQTGMKYYKSIPDEGIEGGQRRVPIQANNVPFSAKLEQFREVYNDGLMQLTNIVSNELDAGNIRNQAVSQEVVKQAKQTGESTSNYIYNSFLNIMQRTAKVVQLRGWDILFHGKKFGIQFYDGYRQALGTNKIEYLKMEATPEWGQTAFDVQIKTVIGDADQNFLESNIQAGLAQKTITLADAIDVREIAVTNVKYAAYVLAQRIDKREKQVQENAMQLAQKNTEAAEAGAKAKTAGDLELEALKAKNAEDSDTRKSNADITQENEKFASILKIEIAKAILADPTKTMADIPSFVFEGLTLDKAVSHANAMNYLQTLAQQSQDMQQQQMAEQQAQQQQMQPEQQGQEQMPPQDPSQQQVAA